MASNDINFEVMVLQGGRWEVHASYSPDQQGQAVRDAKALENISTIKGVKVVRSETNSETGNTKENNIYATSTLTEEQPKGAKQAKITRQNALTPAATSGPAKKGRSKANSGSMKSGTKIPKHIEEYDPDVADKMTFSFFRLIVKLLMVVLFSAIISATVSALGGIWLGETDFRASTQANILNVLFFGSFFLSVVWMSFSFLSKAKIASSRRPLVALAQLAQKPKEPEPTYTSEERVDFGEETNKMAEEMKVAEEKNKTEQGESYDTDDAIDSDDDDDIDDTDDAVVDEDQADRSADTDAKPGNGGVEIGVAKKAEDPWVITQKAFVMDYLADSLENSNFNMATADNFNKFGVNLFIAGAVETLSQDRNLAGGAAAQILGDAVKFMGFRNRDAQGFSDKIPGYLLADSKYMQMYQAGRSSMMTYLEGDAEGASTLSMALAEWNTRKSTEKASGPVTVLFTDIAGSTNMTQSLGDALAQQVVRAHNKIVRDALHQFNGKEVKHTGDGIMASFSKTSNAVEAAADMQKGAIKHSEANPDLPLGLKIGINAGEPIAEENDLFGTTVQLTARIVDKAMSGQVFVSDIVRGLCDGKTFNFVARGAFELKGFDDAITLHELIWDPNASPSPDEIAETTEPGSEIGSEIGADIAPETPKSEAEAEDEQSDESAEDGEAGPASSELEPETSDEVPSEATEPPDDQATLPAADADISPETPPEAPADADKPAPTPGPE